MDWLNYSRHHAQMATTAAPQIIFTIFSADYVDIPIRSSVILSLCPCSSDRRWSATSRWYGFSDHDGGYSTPFVLLPKSSLTWLTPKRQLLLFLLAVLVLPTAIAHKGRKRKAINDHFHHSKLDVSKYHRKGHRDFSQTFYHSIYQAKNVSFDRSVTIIPDRPVFSR